MYRLRWNSFFRRPQKNVFSAWAAAVFVTLLGTGLAVGLFFMLRSAELAVLRTDLTHECRFRALVMEGVLNSNIVQLGRHYSAFIKTKENLDQTKFSRFSELMEVPSVPVFGVGFAGLITSNQREEWERRHQRNLTYLNNAGTLELRPLNETKTEYLPIKFITPFEKAKSLIGLDYFSTVGRSKSSAKALSTGKPTMSGMLPLNITGTVGFNMFYPVFNYTFDGGFTSDGVVSFAFEVAKIIDANLVDSLPAKIRLTLHDATEEPDEDNDIFWDNGKPQMQYVQSEVNHQPLTVADRVWELDCVPSKDFYQNFISPWPIVTIVAIQLIFIGLAILLFRWCSKLILSQKKISEQAVQLEQSNQVFSSLQKYAKTVVSLIPDPMILLDSQGFIIGLNQHALEATDYDMNDILHRKLHMRDFIADSGSHSPPHSDTPNNALLAPGFREITVHRKDNSKFSADASVSTVLSTAPSFSIDRNMNVTVIDIEGRDYDSVAQVIIFHDITERMENLRMIMEKKEMLKKISEERQQMLLWLCHELRNPLHIVVSSLECTLSSNHIFPTEISSLLRSACVASDYITFALDDVLEYMDLKISRPIWGAATSVSRTFSDVIEMVRDRSKILADLKGTNIAFSTNFSNDEFYLSASSLNDFTALILKAAEFAIIISPEDSSVNIVVSTSPVCDRNPIKGMSVSCKIIIPSDVAAPFDMDNLDIFSIEHVSKGKSFGSPGLATTILRKLSKKLKGQVRWTQIELAEPQTRNGLGSCIEILCEVEGTSIKNLEDSAIAIHSRTDEIGSRPTILIAEDNPVVQQMTKRMVEKCGHTAATANDGREAVRIIQSMSNEASKLPIHLVLMDIIMPNLSGFDAASFIRNQLHISPSELPIIAVTANTIKSEETRCMESGLFNEFIPKPMTTTVLKRVLEKWTKPNHPEE